MGRNSPFLLNAGGGREPPSNPSAGTDLNFGGKRSSDGPPCAEIESGKIAGLRSSIDVWFERRGSPAPAKKLESPQQGRPDLVWSPLFGFGRPVFVRIQPLIV